MKRIGILSAIAGLFLIVLIAASVQGIPAFSPPTNPPQTELPPPIVQPSGESSPMPLPDNPPNEMVGQIVGGVLFALAAAGLIALLILIVRMLLRAWRDRPLSLQDAGDVGLEVEEFPHTADPEAAAPVIRRGIAGALRVIDENPIPADAIIAAWVGLEESAADAGMRRGTSETAAEFALRIITHRSGITAEARSLLRLYERVRFGGYLANEQDRVAARTALRRIEEGWQ